MKLPITIYAEMTPNPKAMKFVANKIIVEGEKAYEFNSEDETQGAPLAKVLFTFPFVTSVMLAQNFITISIIPNLDWNDVVLEVREYVTNYLQAGQPVIHLEQMKSVAPEAPAEEEFAPLPTPGAVRDIDKKIKHILKEYVSPAIENDGGAVAFESFENGELKVRLSGACNGCPSSTQTLKNGIQNIFGQLLPEVKIVSSI